MSDVKRKIIVQGTITSWSYQEGTRPPRGAPFVVYAYDGRGMASLAEFGTVEGARKLARKIREIVRKAQS